MGRTFDVVIVGAGPAGTAAALQLARSDPALARRTVLLDAREFPREKLCGGGLVPEADRLLSHLGVPGGFSSVTVRRVVFEYPGGRATHAAPRFFRVVHRREFDDALLREALSRGVQVSTGDAVVHLAREGERVVVGTSGGECFDARVVIGADGARSRVRRALVGSVQSDRFVALETLSRGHDDADAGGSETAVFDFRPSGSGMRGYAWDFPSLRDGEPFMNRGLAAATRTGPGNLALAFEEILRGRGRDPGPIEGAGAPVYDPARPQGAERVLLAGDAVGIDPWFGEGISVALGTGILAAHAAARALASGSFDFESHAGRIAQSAVGWSLRRKHLLAELFYRSAAVPGGMGAFLGRNEPPGSARASEGSIQEAVG